MFTFNCIILFVEEICASNKSFYFLIAVHVILIIAILLYALNTNMCSIYKNSFSFFCLFLMPPSTQRHSRKLIFFVETNFLPSDLNINGDDSHAVFNRSLLMIIKKLFDRIQVLLRIAYWISLFFQFNIFIHLFRTFNRVSLMKVGWENWKFI